MNWRHVEEPTGANPDAGDDVCEYSRGEPSNIVTSEIKMTSHSLVFGSIIELGSPQCITLGYPALPWVSRLTLTLDFNTSEGNVVNLPRATWIIQSIAAELR